MPRSPAGPNASGKSCYVKQVAVIAYLAHVGCFVPAAHARIGLLDRLLSRLVSRERLALQMSTFMIDLTQIAGALLRSLIMDINGLEKLYIACWYQKISHY